MLDEIIASAAIELIVSLSEQYEPKQHKFSLSFERKIARIIRKVRHPIRYQFIQRAACIILVFLLCIMTICITSPTVYAAILEWIRAQYDTYIEYLLPDSLKNKTSPHQYTISQLPDGYYETNRFDVEGSCTVLYGNDTSNRIHFIYSKDPEAISFLVMSDESTIITTQVSGYSADLYIPNNPNDSTSIIWYDIERETIFFISYVTSKDTIISLAESVK